MSDLILWGAPWTGRVLVACLMLLGVAVAWWGRRWSHRAAARAAREGPLCNSCGYSLIGLADRTDLRCPECGRPHTTADKLPSPRWPKRWIVAGLVVALVLPAWVVSRRVRVFGWEYYLRLYPMYALFQYRTLDRGHAADVSYWIGEDRRGPGYERFAKVYRGRDLYFTGTDHSWYVGPTDSLLPAPGSDIDRDGVSDLVLMSFSGGAHCCETFYVLRLSNPPKVVFTFEAGLAGARFEDVDRDGKLDLITGDATFAYWRTPWVASPIPRVIFRCEAPGTYVPSPRLMAQPAPPESDLAKALAEARAELVAEPWVKEGFFGAGALLRTMLDLIYTGHPARAYAFLDQAWPPDMPGREQFKREVIELLGGSMYAPVLEALGHPKFPATRPQEK